MAQLVARLVRIEKVRGSNPLSSTSVMSRDMGYPRVASSVTERPRPSAGVFLLVAPVVGVGVDGVVGDELVGGLAQDGHGGGGDDDERWGVGVL